MGEEQKTQHTLTQAEIRRAELLKQREENFLQMVMSDMT